VEVKAWACTVMSLAVKSSFPTTILCISNLDLVTLPAAKRESTIEFDKIK